MRDELLGRAAAAAAVRHFPARAGDAEFFRRKLDAGLAQAVVDDGEVLLLVRGVILDDEPKRSESEIVSLMLSSR